MLLNINSNTYYTGFTKLYGKDIEDPISVPSSLIKKLIFNVEHPKGYFERDNAYISLQELSFINKDILNNKVKLKTHYKCILQKTSSPSRYTLTHNISSSCILTSFYQNFNYVIKIYIPIKELKEHESLIESKGYTIIETNNSLKIFPQTNSLPQNTIKIPLDYISNQGIEFSSLTVNKNLNEAYTSEFIINDHTKCVSLPSPFNKLFNGKYNTLQNTNTTVLCPLDNINQEYISKLKYFSLKLKNNEATHLFIPLSSIYSIKPTLFKNPNQILDIISPSSTQNYKVIIGDKNFINQNTQPEEQDYLVNVPYLKHLPTRINVIEIKNKLFIRKRTDIKLKIDDALIKQTTDLYNKNKDILETFNYSSTSWYEIPQEDFDTLKINNALIKLNHNVSNYKKIQVPESLEIFKDYILNWIALYDKKEINYISDSKKSPYFLPEVFYSYLYPSQFIISNYIDHPNIKELIKEFFFSSPKYTNNLFKMLQAYNYLINTDDLLQVILDVFKEQGISYTSALAILNPPS